MSKGMPKVGEEFTVTKHAGKWVACRAVKDGSCGGCEVPLGNSGRAECGDFPQCCSFSPGQSLVFKKKREGVPHGKVQ